MPEASSLAPIDYPYGVTATFHARTVSGQDAYGDDQYTDATTDVPGCVFDPGTSTELVQGQDMLRTQPTLYAPAGTPVSDVDRVTVNGATYDVDGSPNALTSPFSGWSPGVVIRLKAVTG